MEINTSSSLILLWLLRFCFIPSNSNLEHVQATDEVDKNTVLNATEFITAISSIDRIDAQPNDDWTTSSKMKTVQVVFKNRASTVHIHIFEEFSLDIIIPRMHMSNTIANQTETSAQNHDAQDPCLSLRIRNSLNHKTGHLMTVKSTEKCMVSGSSVALGSWLVNFSNFIFDALHVSKSTLIDDATISIRCNDSELEDLNIADATDDDETFDISMLLVRAVKQKYSSWYQDFGYNLEPKDMNWDLLLSNVMHKLDVYSLQTLYYEVYLVAHKTANCTQFLHNFILTTKESMTSKLSYPDMRLLTHYKTSLNQCTMLHFLSRQLLPQLSQALKTNITEFGEWMRNYLQNNHNQITCDAKNVFISTYCNKIFINAIPLFTIDEIDDVQSFFSVYQEMINVPKHMTRTSERLLSKQHLAKI